MRFNEKRTCLDFLDNGVPDMFKVSMTKDSWPMGKKVEFFHSVKENFHIIIPAFKKKIQYITTPFYDAFRMNFKKVFQAMDREKFTGEYSGIFIIPINGTPITKLFSIISIFTIPLFLIVLCLVLLNQKMMILLVSITSFHISK